MCNCKIKNCQPRRHLWFCRNIRGERIFMATGLENQTLGMISLSCQFRSVNTVQTLPPLPHRKEGTD